MSVQALAKSVLAEAPASTTVEPTPIEAIPQPAVFQATHDEEGSREAPWYLWWMAFTCTLANLGMHLDASWHNSVGTDIFPSFPHLLIFLSGLCAALGCGSVLAQGTYFRARFQRSETVRMWGFRAPLGAFVGLWGVVAMIAAAPMDRFWHKAFGLENRISVPPHGLLLVGLFAIQFGSLLLVTARLNRSRGKSLGALDSLQMYGGAMILVLAMVALSDPIARPFMHSPVLYRVICFAVPPILMSSAVAANRRMAATWVTAIYSIFSLVMLWSLPLIAATPKAAPVLSDVRFLVPLEFPLLLIVPAIAIDLLLLQLKSFNRLILSLLAGPIFFALMVGAQWHFADFLQSPAADNWFFGGGYLGIGVSPLSLLATHKFFGDPEAPALRLHMGVALLLAVFSTWFGMLCGDWMRRLRR